ncbi:hypothetical protein [Bosea vestrisii]|uniref:Uncharacterized protein n=1 Tax=Bosea vestrisii TaxID=151416 RepID=A0ABW0HAP7_9HYPH
MSIIDLQSHVLLKKSRDVEAFTQAIARVNSEIKFMKDIIEKAQIHDDDKIAILSNFIRIFELSFKSLVTYYSVAYKDIADQFTATGEPQAADGSEQPGASPRSDAVEGTDHGN